MFGLSLATHLFQGSTGRTWNCVTHFASLLWTKFSHIGRPVMPRSRKRHHSRSRSRSRTHSRDRSHERHRKIDSHEKDGKRRKIESYDSPTIHHKRSVSCEDLTDITEETTLNSSSVSKTLDLSSETEVKKSENASVEDTVIETATVVGETKPINDSDDGKKGAAEITNGKETEENCNKNSKNNDSICENDDVDNDNASTAGPNNEEDIKKPETISDNMQDLKKKIEVTPKKNLTPKRLEKKLESEKKRIERQKEREEKERKKTEDKERQQQEKLKQKQLKEAEKQKAIEQKQKEKEMKEEQKRKEREEKEKEKEQKRREKEEKEEQKRQEKDLEKQKKRQKEEELKQKTAAAFANFFVARKSDVGGREERKTDKINSYFMPFEVKSDMRLPPDRRPPMTDEEKEKLVHYFEEQHSIASYLKDLKSGKLIGRCCKTWPFDETVDDDITIIEEDVNLGETICEDTSSKIRKRAKYLLFHENRRPAYFGTWRKSSKRVTPRRPFAEDRDFFNYEEDSDEDWEEEEQGESLDVSDDEDKENEDDKEDYEVDNEFFVPHGHLSDDEVDDEEDARLSPESQKQKLKLLKDAFDEDMKSKTHKLKPRSIGCIWYNKDCSNVDEAIHRYLQPFSMISDGQIEIKERSEISMGALSTTKKAKVQQELQAEHIPIFLKLIHGNFRKKRNLVDQFFTYMINKGFSLEISRASLGKLLKQMATYKKCKEDGPMKNQFGWFVNDEIRKKYDVELVLPNNIDN